MNKKVKMMKIFEVQTELKSYSYPVVKIIMSVLIILLYFWRYDLFRPFNKAMDVIITILGFVFMTLSILCIYISIGELFCVYENRAPEKKVDEKDTKLVTMDYILKIVNDNDIIEIELYSKGHVIKVGASSNCKNSKLKKTSITNINRQKD